MTKKTFPHQRMVRVHRERVTSDFLGIKNKHWQAAARDLGAHALMLYLYLASNADGFKLALSPVAIRQAIGMPASTYRDQFVKLIDKGYLVQRGDSNIFDFYETSQRDTHSQKCDASDGSALSPTALCETQAVNDEASENREININKLNKNTNTNGQLVKQVSPKPQFVF